jgi:hypothetical protein
VTGFDAFLFFILSLPLEPPFFVMMALNWFWKFVNSAGPVFPHLLSNSAHPFPE